MDHNADPSELTTRPSCERLLDLAQRYDAIKSVGHLIERYFHEKFNVFRAPHRYGQLMFLEIDKILADAIHLDIRVRSKGVYRAAFNHLLDHIAQHVVCVDRWVGIIPDHALSRLSAAVQTTGCSSRLGMCTKSIQVSDTKQAKTTELCGYHALEIKFVEDFPWETSKARKLGAM
ncbi:hypothetical protein EX30DRAFT_30356 [Ascodesmis nigricans]|uniref:Uncharacterized protein n=1 Tax=Ascodesmis nigricans TaxID=341454 RepID=A0A4S2N8Q3_9PEZI|nr:hypothetical protein EX30DRAFT_30356 [Ascodesmis nigricans]